MPNHVHGIILLTEPSGGRTFVQPTFGRPLCGALGTIVGQFKAAVTRRAATQRAALWQRNYFERIIRNGRELNLTRAYIASNPANWTDDPHYRP
jgi:REP element-mobilizing transposase RayT